MNDKHGLIEYDISACDAVEAISRVKQGAKCGTRRFPGFPARHWHEAPLSDIAFLDPGWGLACLPAIDTPTRPLVQ